MSKHFKVICKDCGIIISQCRCISRDKVVSYGLCQKCEEHVLAEHLNRSDAHKEFHRDALVLVQPCIEHMLSIDEARQILARCGDLRDIGITLFNIIGCLTMLEYRCVETSKKDNKIIKEK